MTTKLIMTAFDREKMGAALLEQLAQHDGQWVAVRFKEGGWEIVRPRSQQAILDACATFDPIPAERDALAERVKVLEENNVGLREAIRDAIEEIDVDAPITARDNLRAALKEKDNG